MSMQPIKTAIIGYGLSAKTFHIPFIVNLTEFELTAISSSQRDNIANDWPCVKYFETAEALIHTTDAELIIITAPNEAHFSLAKLALDSNKHVILEKPFVTKVNDGETLIKLAAEKKRILSVYHNRRWDGDYLTVKKLISDGKLGDIKHFESHFDRFRPEVRQRWREQSPNGGGILFDLGPHIIDQALQLFGLPNAIAAQCLIMREGSANVDYFNLVLHYPDKLILLHADLYSAAPNKRFSIKGTKGSYEIAGLDPQEGRLKAGILPSKTEWAKESPENYGILYKETSTTSIKTETGGYQHFFLGIANAIQHGTEPPVDAEEALWNIKLIELALESSRLGKTLTIEKH